MSSRSRFSSDNLTRLYDQSTVSKLSEYLPLVIFSDLHLGNGGRTDDFLQNADLFARALRDYYGKAGFTLILNGDVEELQRFRLRDILARWKAVYDLFTEFRRKGRLLRLVGNHDLDLPGMPGHDFDVAPALRFSYHGETIFVFHGHQTSIRFERYNHLVGFGLRFLANPLRITNYSVSHSSAKRFRAEQQVYDFASSNQLLAIIGHTHRPLFESMSKVDTIKFEIERLCRKYPKAPPKRQRSIERAVLSHKAELARIREENDESATVASLYNANLLIPCVFNSGTVVGKRGMTCLELRDGAISLVHWFDAKRSRKYLQHADYTTEALPGTDYHRVVIKSETLDYVFSRIRLLSGT